MNDSYAARFVAEFKMPKFSEQMVCFVQEPECGANQMQLGEKQRVLIFDCGAGTTDITILFKDG